MTTVEREATERVETELLADRMVSGPSPYDVPVDPAPLTVERLNELLQACIEADLQPTPNPVLYLPVETLPGVVSDGSVEIVRTPWLEAGKFLVVAPELVSFVAAHFGPGFDVERFLAEHDLP